MNKKFLTAGLDGKAIFEGEEMFSNYHQKYVVVKGVRVDASDGDVYLFFEGGTMKLSSAIRAETRKELERVASMWEDARK